jgi:hypothetical protein
LRSIHSIRKQFSNLPPHYEVRIRVNIFKIDTWEAGETITLTINGETISKIELTPFNNNIDAQTYCGNLVETDYLISLNEIFPHYDNTINLVIYSFTSGSPDEYWGMNRLELVLYKCNPLCKTCLDPYSCTSCEPDMYLVNNTCVCKKG